jgi:hypothetical protein
MIAWARAGPPAARVTGVAVGDIEGRFARFDSQPTA